jgi:hypothetical protein
MKKLIIIPILGLLLTFCTYGTREGVVQKGEISYLHFKGNTENVTVIIDEGEPIVLDKEQEARRYSPHLLYKIPPGKHTLKAYRNGELILERLIYVASNETKEVEIL